MNNSLIFLLDTDPVKGNFLKYHLKTGGFRNVMLFPNQDECLYSIQRNIIPDFIIADTLMRGMTDLEFLKSIKINRPEIKVIFFSENEDVSHISVLLEAGATDYILRVGDKLKWIHELISNLQYLIKEEVRFQ
jgi:DNA-binding response OmpR family regulator